VQEQPAIAPSIKWLIGIAAVLSVAIAAFAPFVLMLLPNPTPVRVADVRSQPPGIYIATAAGTFHVFPFADKAAGFPAGSVAADPGTGVLVRYRQLDNMDAYDLFSIDGTKVATHKETSQPFLLRLQPVSALPPGQYYAAVAKDSVDGGTDYVYFSVASSPAVP
jgi:hypothetical protein